MGDRHREYRLVSDLFALLADEGIRLRSLAAGRTEHINCHRCGGGSRKEKGSLSVTVDADGSGAVWECHRGTCGWKGNVRIRDGAPRWEKPSKPQPRKRAVFADRSGEPGMQPDWLFDFFGARRISARTVRHFRLWAQDHHYRELGGVRPSVVFPYFHGGRLATLKFRPHPEKNPQYQENDGGEPVLYNADSIDPARPLYWVEGEPDVLAMHEAGYPNVVSLRDGASKTMARADSARFLALKTHEDLLEKVPTHILAGDADEAGAMWHEELARRLGRHKVRTVTWPDGCKDANDTLIAIADLRVERTFAEIVDAKAAVPYPIEGVHSARSGDFARMRQAPPPRVMTAGVRAVDGLVHLPADGRMIVLTGYPNDGKSAFMRHLMMHVCRKYDRRFLVFAGEDETSRFEQECATWLIGKPFWPQPGFDTMTQEDDARAEAFLAKHVRIVHGVPETERVTMDWMLGTAAMCVLRDGVTDVVIDPINELEHQRGTRTEIEYIGDMLRECRTFSRRHGCNIWLIAHPAKPPSDKRKKKDREPPEGYDVAGAAHWLNKCDLGLTVFQRDGHVELHVWKSRVVKLWGAPGRKCVIDFDQHTGRYIDAIIAEEGSQAEHEQQRRGN